MSTEALAIALHHSQSRGATKIVLLGIANHDGDGGSWPAVSTLAMYANTTPGSVRDSIRALENMGEVRREIQAGGTARTPDYSRPNLYQFLLTCPPNCDGSKNHRVLCFGCGKVLPPALRRELYHPECGRCIWPREQPLPDPGDPRGPAHPPGASPPPPRGPAHPEPSFNQPTTTFIEKRSGTIPCARGPLRAHDFTTASGRCAWCGLREDEL